MENFSWLINILLVLCINHVIVSSSLRVNKIKSLTLCVKVLFLSRDYVTPLNGGASFRWSFGPLFAWGSIESATILTTHPSLLQGIIWIIRAKAIDNGPLSLTPNDLERPGTAPFCGVLGSISVQWMNLQAEPYLHSGMGQVSFYQEALKIFFFVGGWF